MAKRILSIMIIALLIVGVCSVFASCGEDTKNDSAAGTTTAATDADTNESTTEAATTEAATTVAATTEAATDNDSAVEDATSSEYTGETVITGEKAIEFLKDSKGYTGDEGFEFKVDGCIKIPDGSVWHSVLVYTADGDLDGSYYVSDTTGTVKTTTEMMAYAYRD